jgi:hypothetical protein
MKLITVIQYLSLAYQTYHCSAMLLCSLYQCLSVCIFLGFLIFCFSLQEHLNLPLVSHCLAPHMPCAFCASAFYALCAMSIQCSIPLLCISAAAHSSFYTPESLSTTTTHLFSVLHTYSLCAPCACYPAMLLHALSCRVLYLFIIATLQLLWQLDPSVNCLYEQSSFHWQIPRDSSAPLAITQKSLRVLWQKPSVVSSSYTVNLQRPLQQLNHH